MRVGLLVAGDLDAPTGGYLYDRVIAEALRHRGETVEVISIPNRPYGRHLLRSFAPGLRRRLQNLDVDVLLQDELAHPALLGTNSSLPYPVATVVHLLKHTGPTPRFRRGLYRTVERRYLRSVDGVIANSETTRRAIDRLVTPTASVVAPPGGDRFTPTVDAAAIRERAGCPGEPLRVLALGSVVPRKGHDVLMSAVLAVASGSAVAAGPAVAEDGPASPIDLRIVGRTDADPEFVDGLRDRIADTDVPIRITGAVSDERVRQELERAHVLALPSRYESFGIAYLEAMGFGVVPIGTTAGAAGEVIGEAGVLVPPDDPRALADVLERLADDRDRLARLGVAARERYEAHPTWEETATTVHAFLTDLVDEYP